ncbi:MAG: hypothetical protein DMG22_02220 [Acidobacteria bacterium]|nr:MAG: hypothetical protein DMG22_02220 [Acidobacteriota bacterium]
MADSKTPQVYPQTHERSEPGKAGALAREPDGIYQKATLVARASGVDVDLVAKEVRIDEVYQSDALMIPEECEFQNYRIMVQRIAFASKIDKAAPDKGRVLRGVTADILGYREN